MLDRQVLEQFSTSYKLFFREYWEGETLRYICADATLGVEAAATEFQVK